MGAIDTLYLVLLIGSLAFGLEALLLGLGGKLMVLYRRKRVRTFVLALGVGLAIVMPAVITSMVLALEPLYFCVLVLAYMFIASRIVHVSGAKLPRAPPRALPLPSSELEVVTMLRKRGYGKLVKKKKSTQASPQPSPSQPSELEVVETLRERKYVKPAKKKRKG